MLRFWISGIGTIESENEIEIKNFATLAVNGFENEEEAQAYINKLPKYVKAKAHHVTGIDNVRYIQVAIEINNYKKVTGEVNETGAKRVKKFVDLAKKRRYIKINIK